MAFRKRNVGISRLTPESGAGVPSPTTSAQAQAPPTPGVRPSPIDGRPTTSTGVQSFDSVLAGHAGLALGSSVLIEENGTTDFAGVMLRYYAAEGLVQGHHIHVLGVGEHWAKDLPEAIGAANATGDDTGSGSRGKEKMKIAWRYERLGEFGATSRGVYTLFMLIPLLRFFVHMHRNASFTNTLTRCTNVMRKVHPRPAA